MPSKKEELTPKEKHFSRCVASGMTYSDAYREAYDTSGKQATVNSSAYKLFKKPKIKARIEYLIDQKEKALVRSAVNDKERVSQFLRQMMETAVPSDTNRIRAAELLGKDNGMFKDNTHSDERHISPDEARAELAKKLEDLLLDRLNPQSKPIDVTDYSLETLDSLPEPD